MSSSRLFVKGLPLNFTKENVEQFFSHFGTLDEVNPCRDFTTGASRGEAFITFKDPKSAEGVLKTFRGGAISLEGSLEPVVVQRSVGEGHVVIVVGGGLAGACAAWEAAKNGSFVIIFEKNANLGGNSEKASSGMNACGTPPQHEKQIVDSVELFTQDTINSSDNLGDPKLIRYLASESAAAWTFLKDALGLSLDAISQLGGHSAPRTHRTPPKPDKATNIGWEIMNAFKRVLPQIENIQIICGASVSELIVENNQVSGVVAELHGVKTRFKGDAVVVTTGGYSFSKKLLEQYAPSVAHLPTTNGKFATGDGIGLCTKVDAFLTGMEHVQVHPTGFIDPKNPTDSVKFLAPEALRGCGGVLLNQEGKRFVNELGRRDAVTQAIFANCKKMNVEGENADKANVAAYLVMNQSVVTTFNPKVMEFYTARGFIQKFNSLKELSAALKLDEATVADTLNKYNAAAKGETKDEFGKSVFPTQISPDEALFVSLITPSIHYTMGGVAINYRAQPLNKNTMTPIAGLYAAGEVTGGVHGKNRLGGNSLLECVIFGRLAGREAATHSSKFPALIKNTFVKLPLGEKVTLSNSTCLFRFKLPSEGYHTGLSLGQYIAIRAPIGEGGKPLLRYYSPVSRPEATGCLDLLIKIDTDGPMGKFLTAIKPGDELEFQGPVDGLEMVVGSHKKVCLLSGGTGIAPMIQIIRAHLLHERKLGMNGEFNLSLIYACKDESEILLRDVLEKHQQRHNNLKLYYTLVNPPAGWTMGKGFVTPDMIKEHFPPPADDLFIVICGPPPFCNAMKKTLDSLGYLAGKHYYSFL